MVFPDEKKNHNKEKPDRKTIAPEPTQVDKIGQSDKSKWDTQ